MTQKEQILDHLRKGGSLTPLESLEMFGCLALSQRMGELRRDGWPIESHLVELPNGKRVARYRMEDESIWTEGTLSHFNRFVAGDR